MLPYGRQSLEEADIKAVLDVLRSDWLTTGPAVDLFESAIATATGGHPVVSCSSGTAALHTAYAAIGLGPGTEVVTTPMTFASTATTATMLGARVVFADVVAETGLIDPEAVAAATGSRTRAITAVDYAGEICDYEALRTASASVGAVLVADAAHSLGGRVGERPVGDLADITCLSFFPTKNITTAEGGAVVCRDEDVAIRARRFHNLGLVREPSDFRIRDEGPWHQEIHDLGLNYRLSDVGCALGLAQLRRLEAFKARRREIVHRYDRALEGLESVRPLARRPDSDPMWHLYVIRVLDGRRSTVYTRMREAGVGVQVNYIPVYWHPVYSDLGYRRGMCPAAETFYSEQLSIPLHVEMSDSDVDRVVDALREALR